MRLDDVARLHHMLEAARLAVRFTQTIERATLDSNTEKVFAIIKAVEIIGEAASAITQQTRDQYAMLPWKVIVGMRNRLIHGYFDVDYDQVWSTVKYDLPPLIAQLEAIIPEPPPDYESPF